MSIGEDKYLGIFYGGKIENLCFDDGEILRCSRHEKAALSSRFRHKVEKKNYVRSWPMKIVFFTHSDMNGILPPSIFGGNI